MADAIVTSRIPLEKKTKVQKILKRSGTNISQVINKVFDRISEDGNASFVFMDDSSMNASNAKPFTNIDFNDEKFKRAAEFVDSLTIPRKTRFDNMTKAEIRIDRLKSRGLM